MSLWVCAGCTTAYSVGAPRCPHCSSTERSDDDMPKINAASGATNAGLPVEPEPEPVGTVEPEVPAVSIEAVEPEPEAVATVPTEAGAVKRARKA